MLGTREAAVIFSNRWRYSRTVGDVLEPWRSSSSLISKGLSTTILHNSWGNTSVDEILHMLPNKTQSPTDQSVVWLALEQLNRAQLLEEFIPPTNLRSKRLSRRELMRKLGAASAIALPVISSIILAPATAHASHRVSPLAIRVRVGASAVLVYVCSTGVHSLIEPRFSSLVSEAHQQNVHAIHL